MNCPKCGNEYAENAVFCPSCGTHLVEVATKLAAVFKFACQHCGQRIAVKPEWSGRYATCPGCAQSIQIPAPPTEAPMTRQSAPIHLKTPAANANAAPPAGNVEIKLAPRPPAPPSVLEPSRPAEPPKLRPVVISSPFEPGKIRPVLRPAGTTGDKPVLRPISRPGNVTEKNVEPLSRPPLPRDKKE